MISPKGQKFTKEQRVCRGSQDLQVEEEKYSPVDWRSQESSSTASIKKRDKKAKLKEIQPLDFDFKRIIEQSPIKVYIKSVQDINVSISVVFWFKIIHSIAPERFLRKGSILVYQHNQVSSPSDGHITHEGL